MRTKSAALLIAAMAIFHGTALAQTSEVETAKPYDTVSPTGVSFPTGSFTYNPDLLSIGDGEFPRKLSYGLRYDSRGEINTKNWTHSLFFGITHTVLDTGDDGLGGPPNPQWYTWSVNVVGGQRTDLFERFGANRQTTYTPAYKTGATLEYIGTNWSGHYKYIGSGGEILEIAHNDGVKTKLTNPDGTAVTTGCPTGITCWYTNLGTAIVVQNLGSGTQKVCAVNLTEHDLNTLSSCPSGVPTATISGTTLGTRGFANMSSLTYPDGLVETFTYNGNGLLTCVKEQGASLCRVSNTYDSCATSGYPSLNPNNNRVISQAFATGETTQYAYSGGAASRCDPLNVTMTQISSTLGNAATSMAIVDHRVTSATNPIGKTVSQAWTGNTGMTLIEGQPFLATATLPDSQIVVNTYDARGNLIESRRKAKTGTGLADIVTSASYLATCTNRVTCNKPTSTTDARGKVTDYTYNATHGGVLTVTAPADANGVRPQTRYTYVQRYAWIKSGSGYAQAASPVWLLESEEFCRTSAASGSSCAAGASDEVVTTYDYGPNSGPNNLWLRGKVVTADGVSLRSCYQRDSYGRVIAETSPNANLSSCS